MNNKVVLIYDNREFTSLASVSKYLGVSQPTLRKYTEQCGSLSKACDMIKSQRVCYSYDNREFETIEDIAKYLGVSVQLLNIYRRKHDTLVAACDAIRESMASRELYYYDNKEFTSLNKLAKYLGVTAETLCRYRSIYGSLEAACDAISSAFVVYDNKRFKSPTAVAEYIGVNSSYIKVKMREGYSFEDACRLAEQYVLKSNLGTASQRSRLKRSLGGDEDKVNYWLTCVFSDYPTKFGDTVYTSVEAACSALGCLSTRAVRARMLSRLITFQEAVHELYYVVDDIVYTSISDAAWSLNVSMSEARVICDNCKTNDERVEKLQQSRGSLSSFGEAITMSRRNSDIKACVPLRDGSYVVYCGVCGRPMHLSKIDVCSFKHSDDFCTTHVQSTLYEAGVSISGLRSRLRLVDWDFDKALDFYVGRIARGAISRIVKLKDVEAATALCGGRYMRIVCAECRGVVVMPTCDALNFSHSDLCATYKWE